MRLCPPARSRAAAEGHATRLCPAPRSCAAAEGHASSLWCAARPHRACSARHCHRYPVTVSVFTQARPRKAIWVLRGSEDGTKSWLRRCRTHSAKCLCLHRAHSAKCLCVCRAHSTNQLCQVCRTHSDKCLCLHACTTVLPCVSRPCVSHRTTACVHRSTPDPCGDTRAAAARVTSREVKMGTTCACMHALLTLHC